MRIDAPMLCARAESEQDIQYPTLATPKLDGVRALMVDGCAVTRRFKQVGNVHVREWMEANLPDGIDGELVVPGADFSAASGLIRRSDGRPEFLFAAFDLCMLAPYAERVQRLATLDFGKSVQVLAPTLCPDADALLRFEEQCLEAGYEGVIARSPTGPYKMGRSTLREQWAVKLKRFQDSEAIIHGFEEGRSNLNPIVRNCFGRAKRPGGRENSVLTDTLGSMLCRDIHSGVEVSIGGGKGMTHALRQSIWNNRADYIGRIVRYEYQAVGTKDAPRFPRFVAFREVSDVSPDLDSPQTASLVD